MFTYTAEYLYLIYEREHYIAGNPYFKLGRTSREGFARFNCSQYKPGSKLLFMMICRDNVVCEAKAKKHFKKKYLSPIRRETEVFEGMFNQMIFDLLQICMDSMNEGSIPFLEKGSFIDLSDESESDGEIEDKSAPDFIQSDLSSDSDSMDTD